MNRACFTQNTTKRKRSHERSELNLHESASWRTSCLPAGQAGRPIKNNFVRMKIGIQTWGSRGDITPWIALGQGLQDAGHEVMLYYTNGLSSEDFINCSREGLKVKSTKEFRSEFPADFNIERKRIYAMDSYALSRYMLDEIFSPYEAEITLAAEYLCENSDLIISTPILYQTYSIAEKLHVPVVILLVDYQFTPKNSMFDPEINKLFIVAINKYRKGHGLPCIDNVRSEVFNSRILNLLIFSKVFKTEPDFLTSEFKISGYLKIANDSTFEIPDFLQKFLDSGTPPVFFSVGSLAFFEDDHPEILDIFLEAIALCNCRAIIQAKKGQDTSDNPNVCFIDFIPHEIIFPLCLAVIHHGGAGTTHTTLLAGCPSIVIAYAWDQFYWGRELVRLGVAPGLLKRNNIDALQLAGFIKNLIVDQEYKVNAEKIRIKMKRENGVKKAVSLIEEYMLNKS
jgi:sterol 3beta-glucosyltransferase